MALVGWQDRVKGCKVSVERAYEDRRGGADSRVLVVDHRDRGAGGVLGSPGAVEKALVLLQELYQAQPSAGLTELAKRTKVAKSTAHRLMQVLLAYGFVQKENDKYQLSHRFAGPPVQRADPELTTLREWLRPFLVDLHALTRATVHLAVQAGSNALCVDLVRGRRSPRCRFTPGASVSAHHLTIGRVLLAYTHYDPSAIPLGDVLHHDLEKIRRDGICIRTDNETGMTTIAAPILRPDGRALAAVSVTIASTSARQAVIATVREICYQARFTPTTTSHRPNRTTTAA